MTADDALKTIRDAWLAWAKDELTDEEFASGVAEALEQAGLPVIVEVMLHRP